MKYRCYGVNGKSYDKYGGIGVTVCDEWKNDFEQFKKWSEKNGYNDIMHLDKDELCEKYNIEPKIYSPDTCQWIMQHKNNIIENQLNNIDTEMKIVKEYQDGLSIKTLADKYYNGKGKSHSAPTKYIEELLKRYGVFKSKSNKTPIPDEVIREILKVEKVTETLKKYSISRSKWYRAKRRYQQRNHTE